MSQVSDTELLPVVNEQGRVIGSAARSECHSNPRLIHPVVHLHVFNSKGELYLQKRAMSKDLLPGFWDTSVGGHIGVGETADRAVVRETFEELGFVVKNATFIANYIWRNKHETEYTYTYYTIYDNAVSFDQKEIQDGRFFSQKEIKEMLGTGFFTPNFENEIKLFEDILQNFLK